MRAVVTGANGHLGSVLSDMLVEQGHDVRELVRNCENIIPLNPPFSKGENSFRNYSYDLLIIETFKDVFLNADCIFHTAAPTQLWSKNPHDITNPIYKGTLNIVRTAADAGVKKIIFTSTCATVGFKSLNKELDETDFNFSTRHPQFKAKLDAERDATELADKLGIQFISVCVPNIIGPGFNKLSPSTEPYALLLKNRLPAIPNVIYHTIDVRDLAQAHIMLAQSNPKHNRYIVAGPLTNPALLLEIAKEFDANLKRPLIAASWMMHAAWFADLLSYYVRFGNHKRTLTYDLVRECSNTIQLLSTKRFMSEFSSWQPRELRTSIFDMFLWIQKRGF